MKDELPRLKNGSVVQSSTASPEKAARLDGSLGFVPAQEVRNVWTEANHKLDQEIWPVRGPVPPRDVMLEFLQDIQFRLLTRASVNLDKVLGRAIDAKKTQMDEATAAMSEAARAAREARLAKYR